MLDVILIDDEEKALQSLTWEIETHCPDVRIVATFTKPREAREFLVKNPIDCIFLDIQMPEIDGFLFLEFFPNPRPFSVIITTAYDQYALSALKERALDYLLKPIDSDDLTQAVDRIRQIKKDLLRLDRLEDLLLSATQSPTPATKKISISCDGKILFLLPDEILCCESDGNYTHIYLQSGEKLFLTQILKTIEEKLPSDQFYRVHHSFLVNLSHVREYQKNEGYLVLIDGKKVPVSRQKKASFLDKL